MAKANPDIDAAIKKELARLTEPAKEGDTPLSTEDRHKIITLAMNWEKIKLKIDDEPPGVNLRAVQ